jgi:hypothetical protein
LSAQPWAKLLIDYEFALGAIIENTGGDKWEIAMKHSVMHALRFPPQ